MPLPAPRPRTRYPYDDWMEEQGVPIYRGSFVPDLRTVELGEWKDRECNAAFIQLTGLEGVCEGRVTEIPPGETSKPYSMAVDELIYIVSGGGTTTVWPSQEDRSVGHTFEWDTRSLFLIPAHQSRQFSNMRGDQPARLLHYDYLPLAMSVVPDPDFFLNTSFKARPQEPDILREGFSQATEIPSEPAGWGGRPSGPFWYGNFFPDMSAWDALEYSEARGAGGSTVAIRFPDSPMSCHMSVFDAKTYKKAHRHGPGRLIVIPKGEGYSTLWLEGGERIVVPWQEAALFVPPDRYYHQHFNLGDTPARYLALHPPFQFNGYAADGKEIAKDQIEYPDEDPWVREHFESEARARGLSSLMPDEAYSDRNYQWKRS